MLEAHLCAQSPICKEMQHFIGITQDAELAEKFVNRIVHEQNVAEDDIPMVYEICRQRFDTLQGIWRRHQAGEDEDRVDVAKRLQERKDRTGNRTRKNTRRQTVSD